jgi:hypothetical protein
MEFQETPVKTTLGKKNKIGELILHNFKPYYKATVIKRFILYCAVRGNLSKN